MPRKSASKTTKNKDTSKKDTSKKGTSKKGSKKTKKKSTPAKTKSVKKEKAAEKPVVEEEPVAEEAVVEEAVVKEEAVVEEKPSAGVAVDNAFTALLQHIVTFTSELSSIKKEVTALRRQVRGERNQSAKSLKGTQKELDKLKKKNEKKPNRKPGGVNKPTLMCEDLCKFLDMEAGSLMAPCHLTSRISDYVKENGLSLKGLEFKTDEKLKTLLHYDGDELSYGNLQKYTSPLFIRN